MQVKLTLVLLAVVALVFIPYGSAQSGEKEASYVATHTLIDHDLNEQCADALGEEECPARIIRGIVFTACDGAGLVSDDEPEIPPTGPDGLGGVSFCHADAWQGRIVRVDINDALAVQGPVRAIATCRMVDPEGLNWVEEIGRGAGTFQFLLQQECVPVTNTDWPEPTCDDLGPANDVVDAISEAISEPIRCSHFNNGVSITVFFEFGYASEGTATARLA